MYNKDCLCYKCSIPLAEGDKIFRTKNGIYCIPCSEIIYYDSTIDVTDEELENFFVEQ